MYFVLVTIVILDFPRTAYLAGKISVTTPTSLSSWPTDLRPIRNNFNRRFYWFYNLVSLLDGQIQGGEVAVNTSQEWKGASKYLDSVIIQAHIATDSEESETVP